MDAFDIWESYYTPIDEFGNKVTKTKDKYPYSYDGHVTWRGMENQHNQNTVWTDRLYQWDYEKYNNLCEKYFGNTSQYWNNREPEKVELFLQDYLEKPNLKLVLIMEYCNASSGYPLWRFIYIEN